jgi:hypothetical protein
MGWVFGSFNNQRAPFHSKNCVLALVKSLFYLTLFIFIFKLVFVINIPHILLTVFDIKQQSNNLIYGKCVSV